MHKTLEQLLEKLRQAYGDRLVSVVLYGSAADGDHTKFSDYNVLCVLSQIRPRELHAAASIFRWWREHGNPAPLLLTEQEIAESTDCFAIEFHDIQRQHRILYGRDIITGLVVDDSFYRAQVERDLRAKLLRLRQKASGVLDDSTLLRRLLLDSVSTFCVLFRHALALDGVEAPLRKRDVVARAAEHFGFDPGAFNQLLDIREERIKPRQVDPAALLGPYFEGISAVVSAVDRLAK